MPISRIFKNEDFGYRTITVERPERDAKGKVVLGTKGKGKGKPVPDAALRDTENVPLSEDVETYFKREVLPHAPDAWIDHEKTNWAAHFSFMVTSHKWRCQLGLRLKNGIAISIGARKDDPPRFHRSHGRLLTEDRQDDVIADW